VRNADDDLEPIPLSDGPPLAPPPPADDAAEATSSSSPSHPTAVRNRFLVALAVVAAIAIVAPAVQLRSIARDTAHDADCSEALVAIVSSPSRTGSDLRQRIESQLKSCLGPDATLPGFGTGTQ
jgi:7-cyano-7-deazaguanine synthase in queuosine biosynthesis